MLAWLIKVGAGVIAVRMSQLMVCVESNQRLQLLKGCCALECESGAPPSPSTALLHSHCPARGFAIFPMPPAFVFTARTHHALADWV